MFLKYLFTKYFRDFQPFFELPIFGDDEEEEVQSQIELEFDEEFKRQTTQTEPTILTKFWA